MQAKVTKEFAGRPDSETVSRQIQKDEIIEGELAQVAVANGWAKEVTEAGAERSRAKNRRNSENADETTEGGEE